MLSICQEYINSIVKSNKYPSNTMKILIVDEDTLPIISVLSAQSNLLENEIFCVVLIESLLSSIDSSSGSTNKTISTIRDHASVLTGIFFIRPTNGNILLLCNSFKEIHVLFKEYYIYFSCKVFHTHLLEQLASCDEHGLIKFAGEVFVDYICHSYNLLSLNIPDCQSVFHDLQFNINISKSIDSLQKYTSFTFNRIIDSIISLIISNQIKVIIRYSSSSPMCKRIGIAIMNKLESADIKQLYSKYTNVQVLLLTDRLQDLVTPLLNQWTYAAMIHELLGFTKSRVKDMSIDLFNDDFFKENEHCDFGQLGVNIKEAIAKYSDMKKSKSENINTISELKKFIHSDYSELHRSSQTVSVHVDIIHELSHIVDQHCLFRVSELEQSIVCETTTSYLKKIIELIQDNGIPITEKYRISILHSLHHSKDAKVLYNHLSNLKESKESANYVDILSRSFSTLMLMKHGFRLNNHNSTTDNSSNLITTCGSNDTSSSSMSSLINIAKSHLNNIKVDNIYTRHSTPIKQTVQNLLKNRLSETDYPFMSYPYNGYGPTGDLPKPDKVFVFQVGGTTWAEYRDLCSSFGKDTICLLSTYIHNLKTFCSDLSLIE